MPSQAPICADVRSTESLEGLIVTPRDLSQRHSLLARLRSALPAARFQLASDGIKIASAVGESLLDQAPDLGLRWSPEAERYIQNRRRVRVAQATALAEVARLRQAGRPAAEPLLSAIAGLDVLDDHQWTNVAAMTIPGGFGLCVFDEQGAGKTVTLIFAYDVLVDRDEVDFLLIVAPKSMVPEWPRDFARFKGDLYKVDIIVGPAKRKRAILRSNADVLVTNFETAVSMEDGLASLLRGYNGRAMLAVDESFYIKNLDAKRTRSLRRLREFCGRAFVLCGTPAPNSPHDLVQQFSLVDFGMTFDGLDIPENRDAAAPVVQQAIDQRGLFVRHLKADVLPQLPAKRFTRVVLPLQETQHRLYAGALQDLILDLRATDDHTFQRRLASFLARRIALLQICSNPSAVAQGYTEVPAKLQALDSILDELIGSRHEKVVLWSFFTASIDAIMHRFTRFNPVRYDGTVSDVAIRREAVRRFQEDNTTFLLVANPAAAGAGLTLHRSRFAIYESLSNQAAHYLQSLDRIHRRGQGREVEYIILLCENTIELQEYDRLINKERAAQQLLGDRVGPPITRQAMLDELLASANMPTQRNT